MKPNKNTCLNCGKEISNRAKYCSDKCTKQYKRNSDKRSDKPNSDTDKLQPGQPKSDSLRDSLTKTDKTFYDRAMRDFKEPYYDFNQVPERSEKCLQCSTTLKTRLRMLKYCSYEHYQEAISGRV